MQMLEREYPSQLRARAKPRWLFTILSVIALACISFSDAAPSQRRTVQSPHVSEAGRLPLTDSVPPQGNRTPTVPVPPPQRTPTIATPTPTTSTSYEAEAPQSTLTGGAQVLSCSY